MASANLRVIPGILAVIIALFIVMFTLINPELFCVTGTSTQETCETDTTVVIGVIIALMAAIVLAGFGLVHISRTR